MAVKKIEIPDLGEVSLYKRRGLRSIRLTIGHEGEVRVSLPYWVPYGVGREFAASRKEWIKSKRNPVSRLRHGSRIGKAHHLAFIPDSGRRSLATRIAGNGEIKIFLPENITSDHSEAQNAAKKASVRALKQQGEKLLPYRLETLARKHGFDYRNVSVKQLKSRWGSCSDHGNIALNCYLMQLPWHLIDYVILHELLHTRIMAHGPKFWNELENYVPNLKSIRKEMKAYRPILLAQ
jgi:predicted metal-dependent hydrolase